MDWMVFKSVNGSVPFWPKLAEVADSSDFGLVLSASAMLTAAARGPFVRFSGRGIPQWRDVLPLSDYRLKAALSWLYDEKPTGCDTPLDRVRRSCRREGPVHHFHDPAVLAGLLEIIGYSGKGEGEVLPGKLWWDGPVGAWKESIVQWLADSGLDEGIERGRLLHGLECLLDELYRDFTQGTRSFKPGDGFLDRFVRARYSPEGSSILPFLRYDVLWSDIRRLTGLMSLRPPTTSPDNSKLRSKLVNWLAALHGQGVNHQSYLRAYRDACLSAGRQPSLAGVLELSAEIVARTKQ